MGDAVRFGNELMDVSITYRLCAAMGLAKMAVVIEGKLQRLRDPRAPNIGNSVVVSFGLLVDA